MTKRKRPWGVTAIALFFVFGATMSGLAACLLWFLPGDLEFVWRVNPRGHAGLVAMGTTGVLLMLCVCIACVTAATGLWRCSAFGYWMALAILIVNLIGDMANVVVMHDWRTLIGLPVGGVMIAYLVRNRKLFREHSAA